jgi:hypothetical protein
MMALPWVAWFWLKKNQHKFEPSHPNWVRLNSTSRRQRVHPLPRIDESGEIELQPYRDV